MKKSEQMTHAEHEGPHEFGEKFAHVFIVRSDIVNEVTFEFARDRDHDTHSLCNEMRIDGIYPKDEKMNEVLGLSDSTQKDTE